MFNPWEDIIIPLAILTATVFVYMHAILAFQLTGLIVNRGKSFKRFLHSQLTAPSQFLLCILSFEQQ